MRPVQQEHKPTLPPRRVSFEDQRNTLHDDTTTLCDHWPKHDKSIRNDTKNNPFRKRNDPDTWKDTEMQNPHDRNKTDMTDCPTPYPTTKENEQTTQETTLSGKETTTKH